MTETTHISPFFVAGITVRTSNVDPVKLQHDMTQLWGRFMNENIAHKITNKVSDDVLCVYTDYEGDHTKPYVALLGCRVTDPAHVPEGLEIREIKGEKYVKRSAHGNLHAGVVHDAWKSIWADTSLHRVYQADWEVYGVSAHNPEHASVDIFVGVA